jgi:four helix bundle protein
MEMGYSDIDLVEESYVKYGSVSSYKELIVWQKSMLLVKEIYILTKDMPDEERFGLTSQIRRAAVSIPSNIAEGWGRNSKGSYINHLKISNGSLCETETQILIIEMLGFLDNSKLNTSKNLLQECSKMLKSIIDKLEAYTK